MLGDEKSGLPTDAAVFDAHEWSGVYERGVLHGIHPIIDGFSVKAVHVEIIQIGFRHRVEIAAVAESLPRRTIGLYALQVGTECPRGHGLDSIQQRGRTGESVVSFHRGVQSQANKIRKSRPIGQAADLHIAEGMKSKVGSKANRGTTAESVGIGLPGDIRRTGSSLSLAFDLAAHRGHWIQPSVFINAFAVAQDDSVAGPPPQPLGTAAGEISAHIHEIHAHLRLSHSKRRNPIGDFYRWKKCFLQPAGRPWNGKSRLPVRVFEPELIPWSKLSARIVNNAQIDIVAQNRTIRIFPGRIGFDDLLPAITVADGKLGDKSRSADGQNLAQIAVAPHAQRQRVIKSISHYHTQAVLLHSEQRGDFVL